MAEPNVCESSDAACTLQALWVYPLKGCAGVAVGEAEVDTTGLALDRAWMLVDEADQFLSQRGCPRLALVRPQVGADGLVLRAPGMLALQVALDRVESPRRVRVWSDEVDAWDLGPIAAQWFSDFLGRTTRLVRFDPQHPRRADRRWTGDRDVTTAFVDAFPLLVTSTGSLAEVNRRLAAADAAPVDQRRFRPNLVLDGLEAHDEDHIDEIDFDTADGPVRLKLVKPCVRCTVPDVDPDDAATGHAVGDALAAYRADPRMGGGLTFGMNAIVLEGVGRRLAPGQSGRVRYAF